MAPQVPRGIKVHFLGNHYHCDRDRCGVRGIPHIHGNQCEAVERASHPQKESEGDSIAARYNPECPIIIEEVVSYLSIAAFVTVSNKKIGDRSRWLRKQGRKY